MPVVAWLGWLLALSVVIGVFFLVFSSCENVRIATPLILSILFTFVFTISIISWRGKVVFDDIGITHKATGNNWRLSWNDIADWSVLEIRGCLDDARPWIPAVHLKAHQKSIFCVNSTFLNVANAREIKEILIERLGQPKDPDNPVMHDYSKQFERRPI